MPYVGRQNYALVNKSVGLPHNYISAHNPPIDVDPPLLNMTWLNTTSGGIWVCLDNTVGANLWHDQGALEVGGLRESMVPLGDNWLECDGSQHSQTEYPELFDVLHTDSSWQDSWRGQAYTTTNDPHRGLYVPEWGRAFVFSDDEGEIYSSTDGVAWPLVYNYDRLCELVYDPVLGAVFGVTIYGQVIKTLNGTDWVYLTDIGGETWWSIGSNRAGTLYTVCSSGAYFSTDGVVWNTIDRPDSASGIQMVYHEGEDVLIALLSNNKYTLRLPSGGTAWQAAQTLDRVMVSIAYSPTLGKVCGINDQGDVYLSSDGISYTKYATGLNSSGRSVCWSASAEVFVAATYSALRYSPDGMTWYASSGGKNYARFVLSLDHINKIHLFYGDNYNVSSAININSLAGNAVDAFVVPTIVSTPSVTYIRAKT